MSSEMLYFLIFLALVALDILYYYILWLKRLPNVEGHRIDTFERKGKTFWQYISIKEQVTMHIGPMKYVDSSIGDNSLAVEVEVSMPERDLPPNLRLWVDGQMFTLNFIDKIPEENKRALGIYTAIVELSPSFIKQHDPILERF